MKFQIQSLIIAAAIALGGHAAAWQANEGFFPFSAKVAAKPYPLDFCIVSDDKLGGMGKPVVFVYNGLEIKLCCKPCRKDFNKDPEKYLKELEKNQR
jgi:hypothetical protein